MKTSKSIRMFRQLFAVGTLLLVFSGVVAQPKDSTNFAKKKSLIEAQKSAFITQKLDLTTTEAQSFWPVYNEYEAKKEVIFKANRENRKNIKNIETMSDKEAQALIDAQLLADEKLLSLKKEYYTKFVTVLPVKKVVKLEMAEKEFKKVLLKMVKENQKSQMMKK